MIFIYILAAAFSLGVGLELIAFLYSMYEEDGAFAFTIGLCLGTPVAFAVSFLPWALIAYCQSPDLVTLKKGEWACTQTKTETTMMPVSDGKTTTMVPSVVSVCVQYGRISG